MLGLVRDDAALVLACSASGDEIFRFLDGLDT